MKGVASPITTDVLRHLQMHGARTRAEITAALGQLPVSTLSNLRYLGHIDADHTTKDVHYAITPRGRAKLAGESIRRKRSDTDRLRAARNAKNYQGRELSEPSTRPGAMDAFRLPSRMGEQLHWPDGRITPANPTTRETRHV